MNLHSQRYKAIVRLDSVARLVSVLVRLDKLSRGREFDTGFYKRIKKSDDIEFELSAMHCGIRKFVYVS